MIKVVLKIYLNYVVMSIKWKLLLYLRIQKSLYSLLRITFLLRIQKSLYSLLRITLLFHRNTVEDLETYVFEMNPYDLCVFKK